jgi:hypothetical protein
MRILSVSLVATILILSGCYKEKVVGSGNIVSEDRSFNGVFTEIWVDGSIDVMVKQGDSLKIVAKDYENLLPYLKTRISGSRLLVEYEDAWISRSKGEVTVTLPRLTTIDIAGSSDIGSIGAFRFDDILVNISGSGNINLTGSAKKLNMRVSGSGDFNGFDMPIDTARLNITGSGSAQLNVSKILDVTISGSGDVIYKGDPSVSSNIKGSGRVRRF